MVGGGGGEMGLLPMLCNNGLTFTFKQRKVMQGLLSEPRRCLLMSSSFTMISRQRFQVILCPSLTVCNAPPQYQQQTTNPPPPPERTVKFPGEMVLFPFEVIYQTRECLDITVKPCLRIELKIRRAAEYF